MPLPTTSDAAPASESSTPGQPDTSTRFGLPLEVFQHAWTIAHVQSYLQIGRTQAYALASDPTFPPRLRTGRSHRWNGMQVMAWLHHEDWRSATLHRPAIDAAVAPAAATAHLEPRRASSAASSPSPAPRPAGRGAPRRDPAQAETDGDRVVRRIIDPASVQQGRQAARLIELFGNSHRSGTSPAGHHPTGGTP